MGTANFGNVYGISNSSLRLPLVDKEIAERLVARAVSIGIDTFDTAQNYGPSLGWITDFSKDMKLRIWSKVSWIPDEFQDFQNFTDYISKYFDNHGRENLELLSSAMNGKSKLVLLLTGQKVLLKLLNILILFKLSVIYSINMHI